MPKGMKRALGALLAALALYSLLGFLILPGVALRIANQQLANYATLPAKLQRVELNPFSLELTLWGLQIGEPGKEQVGFERLYANLQLDSLWSGALHLANVELDKPRTELLFAKDGSLNLTQLFKLPPSQPKPKRLRASPSRCVLAASNSTPVTCISKTCDPANPSNFSTTRWTWN